MIIRHTEREVIFMFRTGMKKRVLSMAVAVAMLMTFAFSTVGFTAGAASTITTTENLLKHSTFEETDVPLGTSGGTEQNKTGNWFPYSLNNSVKKAAENAHTGDYSVSMSNSGDSLEQDVPSATPSMTYTATVWVKSTSANGSVYFGVKNYGGEEIKQRIENSSDYKQYELSFTVSGNSTPRVYVWAETLNDGSVYIDDFEMTVDSDFDTLSIENGKLTVTYRDDFQGGISQDDFTMNAVSSLDEETVIPLEITGVTETSENTAEIAFNPIEALPLEQTVTVDIAYKGQTFALDYTVEANGEELDMGTISSFTADKISCYAQFETLPTVAPEQSDFTIERKIDDGAFEPVTIKSFNYDKDSKTASFGYSAVAVTDKPQTVTVKLTYDEKTFEATYEVVKGEGTVYYVDSENGSDTNNGTSEATAFETIEKINSIEFQPGDQILFKCGGTWTGALMPKGSGEEGNPITIGSYGEGPKPVLMPGEDWTDDSYIPNYINKANTVISNVTTNNLITFYNQEYWVVKDLELYDPRGEAEGFDPSQYYNRKYYYRAILIGAKDVGDLYGFTFDNLTIHGFRGDNSNNGKGSGGIHVQVWTDLNDASKRVPTAINDITVENCTMYNVGRSGFNFFSPWTTRVDVGDDQWGLFGYAGYGEWYPNKNITIRNNVIHDIDGDGILIDNCENVLVEHNTVYRCLMDADMAVGIFNWNSDNTTIQYNEVYDTRPADAQGTGDGQGIEIDALNRDTYVQYNYLHGNYGGVFMWCNTNDLRGFRGIYRYNISENDICAHGVIDWRPNQIDSMAYNNTIYMGEMSNGSNRTFINDSGATGDAKFYNNIFYTDAPMNANTFKESNIEWKNNIFYGFDKLPTDDSNISADPMFVAKGTGGMGLDSVIGYKLLPGSPAIDAGISIENNGGKDYFGTPLTDGNTDIGAAEYVNDPLKDKLSEKYQEAAAYEEKYYTEESFKALTEAMEEANAILAQGSAAEDDVNNAIANLDKAIAGLKEKLADKTTLMGLIAKADATEKGEYTEASYYYLQTALKNAQAVVDTDITVKECEALEAALQTALDGLKVNGEYSKVTGLTATAPSEENAGSDGPASWAVDGNPNTIWHTAYSSGKVMPVVAEDGENNYITIDMGETKNVYKLEYLPRQAGQNNGIIRKYIISYSTSESGEDFVEIASGSWADDTTLKSAEFAPVDARRIRLTATSTAGVGGENTYITAAEIMLYEFVKPETPEADKTAIEAQLDRYNKLDSADYTAESWQEMETVLAQTKTVFENVLATDEQVSEAAESLKTAIDSLQKVSAYELGDVNHTGTVDVDDATAIQVYLVEAEQTSVFDTELADVNGDEIITISDATFIQLMLANRI